MSVEGRFGVDTNTMVYAVDPGSGWRYERAKEILRQISRNDCVLPAQVLAEFFRVTTRKGLLEPERARSFVRDWLGTFRIAWVDAASLTDAMDAAMEGNLSFWDAMIWAVVRQAGCSALITEDMQDGRVLGGVTFLNPFADDAEERLAALGLHVRSHA